MGVSFISGGGGGSQFYSYVDLPEISEPATCDANELRLWVEPFHGFSMFSYKDDGGMVRRIGDNVYVGVNNTGSTIPANTAVYAAGNDLDPLPAAVELAPAKADSSTTMPCIGVTVESIAAGAYGRYMATGILEDVDTSAFSVGDTVYVSKDTAGEFTATKPLYPNIPQEVGTILVDDATVGAALVVARAVGTGIIVGTDVPALNVTVTAKTDNYTVQTSDFGLDKVLTMSSANAKTFTLPSVDASNIGAIVTFVKLGAGQVTIDAADSDTIHDSAAGGTIYNATAAETYATVTLLLTSATTWNILSSSGFGWITT